MYLLCIKSFVLSGNLIHIPHLHLAQSLSPTIPGTMESKARVNGSMLADKIGEEIVAVGRVITVSMFLFFFLLLSLFYFYYRITVFLSYIRGGFEFSTITRQDEEYPLRHFLHEFIKNVESGVIMLISDTKGNTSIRLEFLVEITSLEPLNVVR